MTQTLLRSASRPTTDKSLICDLRGTSISVATGSSLKPPDEFPECNLCRKNTTKPGHLGRVFVCLRHRESDNPRPPEGGAGNPRPPGGAGGRGLSRLRATLLPTATAYPARGGRRFRTLPPRAASRPADIRLRCEKPHRMQRPVDLLVPEFDKLEQVRIVRGQIILLPQEGVQNMRVVGHPVDHFRRGQPVAFQQSIRWGMRSCFASFKP